MGERQYPCHSCMSGALHRVLATCSTAQRSVQLHPDLRPRKCKQHQQCEYSATPTWNKTDREIGPCYKKPRPLKMSKIYISKRGWVEVGGVWGKLPELSLVFGESCRRHLLKSESWIKSRNLSAWIASSLLILLTLGKKCAFCECFTEKQYHNIAKMINIQFVWLSGECITYNQALRQGLSGETQPNGPIHTLGKGALSFAKMKRISSDYKVLFIL